MILRHPKLKTSLILISLLIAIPAFAHPEKDTGNLGEIRQSILEPEAFYRIYGAGWALMDGRSVKKSDLFREKLWAQDHIPDARGLYLRTKNHDRKADSGDPDGDRDLGFYIADQNKSHTHTDAGHVHCFTIDGGGGGNGNGIGGAYGIQRGNGVVHTPISMNGSANIQCSGGRETRPRSIVVNTYIKINRTPVSEQIIAIEETVQNLPQRILRNERLRNVLRAMINEEVRQSRN